MKTNEQIFKAAISEHPFNAGILREALKHYLELLKEPESRWENGFIDFDYWLSQAEKLQERIDYYYQDNRNERKIKDNG